MVSLVAVLRVEAGAAVENASTFLLNNGIFY
jgi:hypothetical protein